MVSDNLAGGRQATEDLVLTQRFKQTEYLFHGENKMNPRMKSKKGIRDYGILNDNKSHVSVLSEGPQPPSSSS